MMNRWGGVLASAVLVAGCAAWRAPVIPEAIRAPAGDRLAHTAYAKGVQVYRCVALKDDAAKGEWAFQRPETELFSNAGMSRLIGRLTTGPTWEGIDGSKVSGAIKAATPAPAPESARWLLFEVTSKSGSGLLGNISSVQRVDTAGGRPPPGHCSKNQLDATIRVPYTATFHFYTR